MEWHRYSRLFPMLGDDELQALADDIRQNGLKSPIVIDQHERIIDGRNRAAACAIANVKPIFEPFVGTDAEILSLVVSLNVHRRHLTESQRAMIAADIATLPKHIHKPDEADGPIGLSGVTVAEAAEKLKVGERSVKRARKVQQQAAPEVQQAVRDGKVSISKAAEIADLPAEKQAPAIAAASKRSKSSKASGGRKPARSVAGDDYSRYTGNRFSIVKLKRAWETVSERDRKAFVEEQVEGWHENPPCLEPVDATVRPAELARLQEFFATTFAQWDPPRRRQCMRTWRAMGDMLMVGFVTTTIAKHNDLPSFMRDMSDPLNDVATAPQD